MEGVIYIEGMHTFFLFQLDFNLIKIRSLIRSRYTIRSNFSWVKGGEGLNGLFNIFQSSSNSSQVARTFEQRHIQAFLIWYICFDLGFFSVQYTNEFFLITEERGGAVSESGSSPQCNRAAENGLPDLPSHLRILYRGLR